MEFKLFKEPNKYYSAKQQVLYNRGIPFEDIEHYLHTTDEDINDFKLLGEDNLYKAASALSEAIRNKQSIMVIVDCDCDGYTSAALLINYLYDFDKEYVKEHVSWYIHTGKQHGLNDCIEHVLEQKSALVILPDAGTNDIEECKTLQENGIKVFCLDHHISEKENPYLTVINNQTSEYPNKELSGVGITWQFCRYLDYYYGINNADNYLDLVAIGNSADMMSLRSIETKHLINKGLRKENVKNPFIKGMWKKNSFKLGENLTSWGAVFYIVPFVNAMVRSGTPEEKELLFKSMLNFYADELILSTKRGHKAGEQETILDQALRTCTNVKNRQTKAQDKAQSYFEEKIIEENKLEDSILLFPIEPGVIDRNIAGLLANRLQAKYQHPVCILTKGIDSEGNVAYSGSARGCDKIGINQFKEICEETGLIEYAIGHSGAFGLSIKEENINKFLSSVNGILENVPKEAIYYVDYIFDNNEIDPRIILDIADMSSLWGKDIDESLIAIKDLYVTADMITLMSKDKNPTLKIQLPNGISIIKFGISEDEFNILNSSGYHKINLVAKCNKNEWMGRVTPQLMMEDYEIIGDGKYYF